MNKEKAYLSLRFLGGAISASLLACGTTPPPPIESLQAPGSLVVDLLIQRESRFQRYHLVREVLWQECGNLKEESLAPSETHISMLDENERTALVTSLSALLKSAAEESLPSPESEDSDVVTLTLKQDEKANTFVVSEKTLRGLQTPVAKSTKEVIAQISLKGDGSCLKPTPAPSSPPLNR